MLSQTPAKARVGFVLPECLTRFNPFTGALSKDVLSLFYSVGIITTLGEDKPKRTDKTDKMITGRATDTNPPEEQQAQ